MTCGLIGRRLGHSYSPQIHRALADYDYKLWELEPEELETFFRHQDFTGVNVTIPYKQAVIPLLDEFSETARAIGAVNTVVRRGGKLYGDNTDFAGMAALIHRIMLSLEGKKVLILGTAARRRRLWPSRAVSARRRCTVSPAAAAKARSPMRTPPACTRTRTCSSTRPRRDVSRRRRLPRCPRRLPESQRRRGRRL